MVAFSLPIASLLTLAGGAILGWPAATLAVVAATAGAGLVFFAATMDSNFRALNLHTGEELWKYKLPNTAQATPITYVHPASGEQFVVLAVPVPDSNSAVGGDPHSDGDTSGSGSDSGGYLLAFKLPAQ